jgi:hypothetical protein
MKKILKFTALSVVLLIHLNLSAQQLERFRIGFDAGMLTHLLNDVKVGFTGSIELKYSLRDDMSLGFKAGYTYLTKNLIYSPTFMLFSITYDYYFQGRRSILPFIGAGVGYSFGRNDEISQVRRLNNLYSFVRLGFELSWFRVSLAYNLLRNRHEELLSLYRNNDYISLTVGVRLGR